ncbi:MAG TPA: glycosyltransferase family 2 protein [Steroidobacteraceae bacterium]
MATDDAARADVCAVLVTYHPDSGFPQRLRDILQQVATVVVVDNGSASAQLELLRDLAAEHRAALVLNGANLGLARALNVGIEHAAALGFSWAVLLDQDSRIDGDMVKSLVAVRESFTDKTRLGIIGAGFREKHRISAKIARLENRGNEWQEVETVITSGSMLSLSAYRHIGPFREDFFIDHVDTEYCARARARGYRVVRTLRPLMTHSIGRPTQHRLLWMKKWTSNHSADRRYYITRNHTVMLREGGGLIPGSWALLGLLRGLNACKRIALYEEAKREKIAAVFSGWRDGIKGKMGPRSRKRVRASKSALR